MSLDIRAAPITGPPSTAGMVPPAHGSTPALPEALPLAGLPFGSANAILAGLSSPLVHAGLMSAAVVGEAAAFDPGPLAQADQGASLWSGAHTATALYLGAPAGRAENAAIAQPHTAELAQPTSQLHHAQATATQPLVPAWVTALQMTAPRLQSDRWPPGERRRRQDEPGCDLANAETEATPQDAAAGPEPAASAPHGQPGGAAWPAVLDALLPPEVRAELARLRSVLIVAPPNAGQRGLQLSCLGFNNHGKAVCHHWAARGAAAATDPGSEWVFWRVRREGDDGQRPLLHARLLKPNQTAANGLVMRATATVLPAPLRPPGHAWLDVLEPQRLWRNLGSQWTLLLAWSPHPLPLQASSARP